MAMEISNNYSNYAGSYASKTDSKKTEKSVEKDLVSASSSGKNEATRKTVADELSYLSKKYDGYTFVAANFKPGMKYGSNDTTNVAISPAFLKKMANNPELEAKYEKEIANMKKCDEEKVRALESNGDKILGKGWAIDENGGISSWTVGIPGGNRPKVTSPNEYGAKVRRQKAEKKKAEAKIAEKKKEKAEKQAALEEKRQAAREESAKIKEQVEAKATELLSEKYKGEKFIDVTEVAEWAASAFDKESDGTYVGVNLDMKL